MFRIDPEVLNNHARELALEGQWAEGQRFLMRCIVGFRAEDSWRVMSGEARLVGDGRGGVDFAPGPDAEDRAHAAAMALRWAGAMRALGAVWQPYAAVTSFGPEDINVLGRAPGALGRVFGISDGRSRRKSRDWMRARPLHYADNPLDDLCFEVRRLPRGLPGRCPDAPVSPVSVLFRRLGLLPPWIDALRSRPEDAVADLIAAGGAIEERGHVRSHGVAWATPKDPVAPTRAAWTRSAAREEEDARAAAEFEAGRRRRCEAARAAVLEQMALPGRGGRLAMPVAGGDTVLVPRAPFERWALERCGAAHLAPPWDACSTPGLKKGMANTVAGDDPVHTDWMLGAGLDPLTVDWHTADAPNALRDAADALMRRVQAERLGFSCAVLAGRGSASGRVWIGAPGRRDLPDAGDIVVLPDASARWLEAVSAACAGGGGGVVVARGGAMAHLVSEIRAAGVRVALVPDAHRLFAEGQLATVDCDRGRAEIHPVEREARGPEGEAPDPAGPRQR